MSNYIPLTKKVINDKGSPMVVCQLNGTNECQIHIYNNCNKCPVFQAILLQLNAFEEIYLEEDDEERIQ